jgi:hypothetical protein
MSPQNEVRRTRVYEAQAHAVAADSRTRLACGAHSRREAAHIAFFTTSTLQVLALYSTCRK